MQTIDPEIQIGSKVQFIYNQKQYEGYVIEIRQGLEYADYDYAPYWVQSTGFAKDGGIPSASTQMRLNGEIALKAEEIVLIQQVK